MIQAPLSQPSRKGDSTGCVVVFLLPFLIGGLAGFYFLTWRPLARVLAARSWTEESCIVLESRVAESSDSDGGSTYKPEIVYSYSVGGVVRQSERYEFADVYSSGYEGKAEIVARYPPGLRTVCYINPEDPGEAVLNRGLSLVYLLGLFPLLFAAAGAGGIALSLRARSRRRTAAPEPLLAGVSGDAVSPFGVVLPAGAAEPRELRPKMTRLGKLVGLVLVGLFWNGIVSVFVWQAVETWQAGQPDGCLTLFLVPFVLVGLLLIFGAFRQLLVLFNPRLKLTLGRTVLAPGETVLLQWSMTGRAAGVRRLRILLEGQEVATYRRGTDTHTDTETFASIPVVDTDQPYQMMASSAALEVPAGAMPSFAAEHNKIVWTLKAVCEVPGWPDSEDEYEVLVAPGTSFGGWR